MTPSPLEIRTCDRCSNYVPPRKRAARPRCILTGLAVCSKAKGCFFYNRSPSAAPAFMRPGVVLIQTAPEVKR